MCSEVMLLGIKRTILVYAKPWFSWFGGSGSAAERNLRLLANATLACQNLSRGFTSFQKTWPLALSTHLQVRHTNTLSQRTVPRVQNHGVGPYNPNLQKSVQKSCCLEIERTTLVYVKPGFFWFGGPVSAGTLPTGQVKISI